jgi:hypothetical protein
MVMLGFFCGVTELVSATAMEEAVRSSVPPKTVDLNVKAFNTGLEYARSGEGMSDSVLIIGGGIAGVQAASTSQRPAPRLSSSSAGRPSVEDGGPGQELPTLDCSVCIEAPSSRSRREPQYRDPEQRRDHQG